MPIKKRAISNEQKEERRLAILEAALALFQEGGYEHASMAAVARRAGVAKGTVYLYFKTKEELFLALQQTQYADWFDAMDGLLAGEDAPLTPAALAATVADSLQVRPAFVRLIAILHTTLERNIDLPTALAFKEVLRVRALQTGEFLERRLPFLEPGQGVRLLLHIQALVIGVQHLAEPAPIVQQALREEPNLAIFEVDFQTEFRSALESLLAGLETLSHKGANA